MSRSTTPATSTTPTRTNPERGANTAPQGGPATPPRRLLDEAPTGQGSASPVRGPGSTDDRDDLQLPHERDQSVGNDSTGAMGGGAAGDRQREVMTQAGKDLHAGQVDTDLRATPGLDAQQRDRLVDDRQGHEERHRDAARDAKAEAGTSEPRRR